MYKINVLIVTYKQADVIGRNIESIIKQKEYGLKKIIICDDCSPDNNWDVIQRYKQQYPDYIEAYRNENNLGIYGNSNKLMSKRGDADLYCWLEGDDALCDGFFKAAQSYISDKNIDLTAAIGIFSGFKIITSKGQVVIRKNDFFRRHCKSNPSKAHLHGAVSWRSGLFSSSVLNRFIPVPLDKGLLMAESLFDSQWFKNVESVYYMPYISSIYYSGIGVSLFLTSSSSYQKEEALVLWRYYGLAQGLTLVDKSWIKANINRAQYNIEASYWKLIKYCILYIVGSIGYPFSFKVFLLSLWNMLKH